MPPKILYISGTFKEANYFLKEVADELNDRCVHILKYSRQRLILATEYAKLRGAPANSHDLRSNFATAKYFMRGYGAFEFRRTIDLNIRPGMHEIESFQELFDLLSENKTEVKE